MSRVNYYVKELYGDPDEAQNLNAYGGALGVLITKLPLSELHIFRHPVIRFVVDLKWDQFARLEFIITQIMNFMLLLLGTVWLLIAKRNLHFGFWLANTQVVLACLRLLGQGNKFWKETPSSECPAIIRIIGKPTPYPDVL